MSFLLDTSVLSETIRRRSDANVLRWLNVTRDEDLFVSVITLSELRYGIERLPDGQRRIDMEAWLHRGIERRFARGLIPVDLRVADAWGRLRAELDRKGRPVPVVDGLLAATALVHSLTLVTRNVRDFADTGIALLDPWVS